MQRLSEVLVNLHGVRGPVEAREANEAIRAAVKDAQERIARATEDAGAQASPALTVPLVVSRLASRIRGM
jgi:hypothetical protein